MDLKKLDTEKRNEKTMGIDEMSTMDMVRVINDEDHRCAEAVKMVLPQIAQCVDVITDRLKRGGRLFYAGAGTSGRLGVLDAAECPPTYGVDPGLVVGLIAGGETALTRAMEGAEDDPGLGARDLEKHGFGPDDALVGIAASGRTPYVIGAMDYARQMGGAVMALVCVSDSELSRHADITMAPLPGPEVITGSSRMKAGTCQKLTLNLLSTCVMIRLGKVYGNLMVDVRATNEKLRRRAISIVCTSTGADEDRALAVLKEADWSCKTAIVMIQRALDAKQANEALARAEGRIAAVLKNHAEAAPPLRPAPASGREQG